MRALRAAWVGLAVAAMVVPVTSPDSVAGPSSPSQSANDVTAARLIERAKGELIRAAAETTTGNADIRLVKLLLNAALRHFQDAFELAEDPLLQQQAAVLVAHALDFLARLDRIDSLVLDLASLIRGHIERILQELEQAVPGVSQSVGGFAESLDSMLDAIERGHWSIALARLERYLEHLAARIAQLERQLATEDDPFRAEDLAAALAKLRELQTLALTLRDRLSAFIEEQLTLLGDEVNSVGVGD